MWRPVEGRPTRTSPAATTRAAARMRRRSTDADDEARQVEVAAGVEARASRPSRRPAGRSRSRGRPLRDARRRRSADHVGLELAGGEIVEEEQRPRALDQDVVDAVVDQVLADGVVAARQLRRP